MSKGKSSMVLYPRQYVPVAQHCAIYLHTEGYLNDKCCITRDKFKNVFEEEYKQKYPIRASCSNVLAAMNYVGLIKKRNSRNPGNIFFIRNSIDTLLEQISNEILQMHPDESLAKPKLEIFVNRQDAFQPKKEKSPDIEGLHCLLCKIHLSEEFELEKHKTELRHKLRSMYRNHRQTLDGKHYFMATATVSENVKIENGECLVRLRETVNVEIILSNKDKVSCNVTNVSILIPSSEIKLSYSKPSVIKPGGNAQFAIVATFHEIAAVVYPVVFHIVKKKKKIYVLHEMVFRVQDVEVDSYGPTTPYEELDPPVLTLIEYPVISGVPPPSSKKTFPCIIPLGDYKLPASVTEIINSGFEVTPEMEKNTKKKLERFLGMLKITKKGKVIADLKKENYTEFMRFLLHMEEHQMLIDIHKYDCEEQTMKLHRNGKLCILEVPGLSEKRPSVMKNDRLLIKIAGESVQYEGIVHEVREVEVYLGFPEEFMEKFVENLKMNISFTINRYPLRLEHRALMLLDRHGMTSLMFPNKYDCLSNSEIPSWFNRLIETNEEQKTAVRHIVSGSFFPSPYVVFGPPGTGKTVTIVEAILQLWRNRNGARILACTPSNAAADVLTSRILPYIPKMSVLRMYADCCAGDNIPEDIKQSSNFDSEEKSFYFSLEDVLKKEVVVSTLITAGRLVGAGLPAGHFTHIFIDESGHAPEPELLVPVSGLLTNSDHPGKLMGRLVLAGDPKQLGPILRSVPASILGLGTSFLERLVRTNEQYKRSMTGEYNTAIITKLVKNFRSHELILKVPSDLFYDNELQACGGDLTKIACRWSQLPKKEFPIIFHGVQGKDERQANSPSFFNRQEINVVMKYVEALFEDRLSGYKVQEKDIGIITPYRLQVHKFRDFLAKKWSKISVGSVEEFQGQERLIIIISTVRSSVELLDDDYKHHLGFLRNPKRFNVAVTRAKALLIIVGNPNILQYDRNWKTLLEFCCRNGAYKGCKFQQQPDDIISDENTAGLDFAGLSLDEPSNVEDGPQWRSEM